MRSHQGGIQVDIRIADAARVFRSGVLEDFVGARFEQVGQVQIHVARNVIGGKVYSDASRNFVNGRSTDPDDYPAELSAYTTRAAIVIGILGLSLRLVNESGPWQKQSHSPHRAAQWLGGLGNQSPRPPPHRTAAHACRELTPMA